MEADSELDPDSGLSPEEAFAILGNETRLQILLALREADGILSFSELFDRVEYRDYSNFDYHLEKLEGPFLRKTDAGYDLLGTGRRLVAAVLSGTVSEEPVLEPSRIDEACPFCEAPVEVAYQQEHVELYCTDCPGIARDVDADGRYFSDEGFLSHFWLPPAGLEGRTPAAVLEAAWTWGRVDLLADSIGVCSRCAATLEQAVTVCEDHDASDGYCDRCDRRYATRFEVQCRNCHYDVGGIASPALLARTDMLAFLTTHGVNPLAPESLDVALRTLGNYEETVHGVDPFEAEFTYTLDGDAISLTVTEDLSVTDVRRHDADGA